jgi:hypothetical protein
MVKLTGTGRRKRGMFGETTGPVDNVPSDAPLCDNRKRTEQGAPDNPRGDPVPSTSGSAMREIWWDAMPDYPPNVS